MSPTLPYPTFFSEIVLYLVCAEVKVAFKQVGRVIVAAKYVVLSHHIAMALARNGLLRW